LVYYREEHSIKLEREVPMKALKVLKVLALTFCCFDAFGYSIAQTLPAQASPPRFTLHLSSRNPQVEDGSAEVVVIEMKNIWNHPLAYGVGGPGGPNSDFHFHVVDEQGREVKETSFGKKMHDTDPNSHGWIGSMGTAFVPVGEIQTRGIALGKEYDVSASGTYRVTVSRFDELAHTEVTSNEIQFTISPK
jgi:hypothetical protein